MFLLLITCLVAFTKANIQESSAASSAFPNSESDCTSTACAATPEEGCEAPNKTKVEESLKQFSNEAFPVVFENNAKEPVRLWWDDGKGGVFQGDVETTLTITTYVGHKFFFTPADSMERLWSTVMRPAVEHVTLFDRETMQRRTAEEESARVEWMQQYYASTGRTWRNYWPRDPVQHFVYDVSHIGQTFDITSQTSFAVECPPGVTESTDDLIVVDDMLNGTAFRYCVETAPVEFELKVLCAEPRVVRILKKGAPEDSTNVFVSKFEAANIISTGSNGLARSTVSEAATLTEDRTSSTSWIERSASPIVDRVIRRLADVVQIDESKLHLNRSSESLQLVHYETGQLYKSHHDYGTDRPNNRFITFLIYLNHVGEGGNTSFPQASAECHDNNGYFGLHPGEGNAMFFYNLFADGNVDPSTLHYAEPPTEGEKYMSNMWIWDPFFS